MLCPRPFTLTASISKNDINKLNTIIRRNHTRSHVMCNNTIAYTALQPRPSILAASISPGREVTFEGAGAGESAGSYSTQ